jgi:uncharacterized protein YcnI
MSWPVIDRTRTPIKQENIMYPRTLVRAITAVALTVTVLAVAGPASAHVGTFPDNAAAGGYSTVYFQVPHGCDGSPTTTVAVKLTDDISSVKAEMVPGWTATYTKAPLAEPFESYGKSITEYVDTVTWTAQGEPLPDDQFMRFGISMKVPDLAGEDLLLPTVQTCVDGTQEAWIDSDPEADSPAPRVALTASEGGGHGGGSAAAATGEVVDAELAAGSTTTTSSSTTPALIIAIVALVVALGAAVATIAGRRRSV